jgi:[CysO sulfur-carrier protein]-S-L-cysteine hydrolase
MTIRIKQSDFDAMTAFAREGLPNEACGLIAGKADENTKTIEKVYFLTNTDANAEHFSIDPKEQLAAVRNMRELGLVPLGNFHSHPSTPARLSDEDIKLAYDPKASYLVLSLAEELPVLKAFEVKNGEVSPQTLEIG